MRGAVLLCAVAVAAAGCVGPPTANQITLADLEACDFQDADGAPVPCTSDTLPLEWNFGEPELMDGYVCSGKFAGYTFYQGMPGLDEWAIGYDLDLGPGVWHGIAEARAGNGDIRQPAVALYEWRHEAGAAYVEMPPLPEGAGSWSIRIYNFHIESEDPVWRNATVTPIWSIHEAEDWVVWQIDSAHGRHYAHNMATVVMNGVEFTTPSPVRYVGEDFEFGVDWTWNGGLGAMGPYGNLASCALAG